MKTFNIKVINYVFMANRIQMSSIDVINAYRQGRRDFSDILVKTGNFANIDLSEASFKNSDLSFSSFASSIFKKCDFSDAFMTWCDFTQADFSGSIFTKAVMGWSRFEDTKLDNADLTNADVSWSLFLNTDKMKAKSIKGLVESGIVTDLSQLEAMDISLLASKIEELKDKLPHDLYMKLKFKMHQTMDKIGKDENEKESFYNRELGGSGRVGSYGSSGSEGKESYGDSSEGGTGYSAGSHHKKKKSGYEK